MQNKWPEIVHSSGLAGSSRKISEATKSGQLRKIAPKLYTPNFEDEPEQIIQRNIYQILGHQYPGAVLSHRSALEAGPKDNNIFLTYKYTKKITLPGLTIRLLEGPSAQPGDTPFIDNLFISSRHRALLENMSISRGGVSKTLSSRNIEDRLDKICRIHGETELNLIRDKAKELSDKLGWQKEFTKLNGLIGTILGTKTDRKLSSAAAMARSEGVPYDSVRLELFAKLFAFILQNEVKIRKANIDNRQHIRNLSFFEAYFSNYIEGTEFEISEAVDIVFNNKIIPNRMQDSHDILGTFKIVSDIKLMSKTPSNFEDFIDILCQRHFILMEARPENMPGKFKEEINRAGDTVFVSPELVLGTLKKAYDLYEKLPQGFARAIFMMFVVSEVHPFTDGNGRIARIMMNSELVFSQSSRIIIPTVYREDYLLALRALSRGGNCEPYSKMMDYAQEFTSRIDFTDYNKAISTLTDSLCFMRYTDGKLRLP